MGNKRPASLADIADRRYQDLTRFLRHRLRDTAAAQDLAQEAFMRLLRRSRDELVERPEAYLFRIAANLAYEQHLKVRATTSAEDAEAAGELLDAAASPERRAIGRQRLERIGRAIAALPPLPRAALTLQRRDGLSYAEIAQRLNTTPHMVKKHLATAMQQCRQVLVMDNDD